MVADTRPGWPVRASAGAPGGVGRRQLRGDDGRAPVQPPDAARGCPVRAGVLRRQPLRPGRRTGLPQRPAASTCVGDGAGGVAHRTADGRSGSLTVVRTAAGHAGSLTVGATAVVAAAVAPPPCSTSRRPTPARRQPSAPARPPRTLASGGEDPCGNPDAAAPPAAPTRTTTLHRRRPRRLRRRPPRRTQPSPRASRCHPPPPPVSGHRCCRRPVPHRRGPRSPLASRPDRGAAEPHRASRSRTGKPTPAPKPPRRSRPRQPRRPSPHPSRPSPRSLCRRRPPMRPPRRPRLSTGEAAQAEEVAGTEPIEGAAPVAASVQRHLGGEGVLVVRERRVGGGAGAHLRRHTRSSGAGAQEQLRVPGVAPQGYCVATNHCHPAVVAEEQATEPRGRRHRRRGGAVDGDRGAGRRC